MNGNARRPVLVLGGSGFIGSRVVAALSAHPLWRPVSAGRRPAADGSRVVVDATDPVAVKAAVRDVAAVVNCIAGAERTMTRATEVLCEARPARIVHLSSMAVYGAAVGTVLEDSPPVAPVSGYGQAKIGCEAMIRRFVDSGGEAVVLRPTCVFGPGSTQWTTRIARLLQARRLGDLGSAGDGCCNLAFIDDVAASVVASLEVPSGGVFNLNSSAELTWNQFLLRFARALGATPVRRIPARELKLETKLLAIARRLGSKVVKGPITEAITPSLADLLAQDIRVDAAAAAAELGVRPTSVDGMIEAAVGWLRQDPALRVPPPAAVRPPQAGPQGQPPPGAAGPSGRPLQDAAARQ